MRTALRCCARLPITSQATSGSLRPLQPLKRLLGRIWHHDFPPLSCTGKQRLRFASSDHRQRRSRTLRAALKDEAFRVSNLDDPKSFLGLYDEFLPADLKLNGENPVTQLPKKVDVAKLWAILDYAHHDGKIDLWQWMVRNGYRRQLTWLIDAGLRDVASRSDPVGTSLLSNIQWPDDIFDDLHNGRKPIVQSIVSSTFSHSGEQKNFQTPMLDSLDRSTASRSNTVPSDREFMQAVWLNLAKFVLEADTQSDSAQSCMTTVLLVLATLHNLEMVPSDVYAYKLSMLSSVASKPPITHIVSSRILTSLSDATWRQQQDEAIIKAAQLGHSLKQISETVPGGRFRLKVQALPTEIWLELILWCCVDSGYLNVACDIIYRLHSLEDPWFAVRWCATRTSPLAGTLIDWNRVQLRYSRNVGLIEGYSRDKPFIDVPSRTVSVEIVLALIERLLSIPEGQLDYTLEKVHHLIDFLEPHDLSPSYFDYLESRLVDMGYYDVFSDPNKASQRLAHLEAFRRAKPIKNLPKPSQSLALDCVLDHNLLHVGVMQQSLDALIGYSAVHNALELFNDIQEEVDRNKLQSIVEFLKVPVSPNRNAFTFTANQTHSHRLEYADSHGQIPHHKLAAFLDLTTEAKMFGIGDWLLYSEDLDDTLIPSTAFTDVGLAPSITRYAAANNDGPLLARIKSAFDASDIVKASVRTCRTMFDAEVSLFNFIDSARWLYEIKRRGAQVGVNGYAYLGAAILRIENDISFDSKVLLSERKAWKESSLRQAKRLLNKMLSGFYQARRNDDTLARQAFHTQQISHMLRIYAQCNGSILQDSARRYAARYASGNNIMLPTRAFNVLLDGIVDAFGPVTGRRVFEAFCRSSSFAFSDNPSDIDEFDFTPEQAISSDPMVYTDLPSESEPTPGYDSISGDGCAPGKLCPSALDPTDRSVNFIESFFPNGLHPANASDDVSGVEAGRSRSIDSTIASDRFLRSTSVTVPQASTLRVIIQGVRVQRDRNSISEALATEIEQWAIQQFTKLDPGTRSLNVVAQELQRPLSEADIKLVNRRVRYEMSQDHHPLANDHLGLYQAKVEAKKRSVRRQNDVPSDNSSLWADYI